MGLWSRRLRDQNNYVGKHYTIGRFYVVIFWQQVLKTMSKSVTRSKRHSLDFAFCKYAKVHSGLNDTNFIIRLWASIFEDAHVPACACYCAELSVENWHEYAPTMHAPQKT